MRGLISYSNREELRVDLKDKVAPSSCFLRCSPQSAQYGFVPAVIPPAPPATSPRYALTLPGY